MGAPDLRLPVDFEKKSLVRFDSGANQVYMKSPSSRAIYSRRKKQLQKRLNQLSNILHCYVAGIFPQHRALSLVTSRSHDI